MSKRVVVEYEMKMTEKMTRVRQTVGKCNSIGDGHSNDNCNCNSAVTGYPPISERNHSSFSEASVLLCDELKQDVPQLHVSRRCPTRVHVCTIPVAVDIDVQVKSHEGTVDTKIDIDVQMIDKKHTVTKHVRSRRRFDAKMRMFVVMFVMHRSREMQRMTRTYA